MTLSKPMICHACGGRIEPRWNYCAHCGSALPNGLFGMIDTMRRAAHARCRVKAWRVTWNEAFELSGWLADNGMRPGDRMTIYWNMIDGLVSVLGARVKVVGMMRGDDKLMSIQRGTPGR